MVKKIFVLFISLLMLVMFASCNDSHTHNFTSDSFFHVEEGDDLTNEEMQSVISDIPSDKYESYPNTQNVPVSATLYKNGEKISIDVNDPRLIKLTNFFNRCVYYSKCAYTQGLLPLDDLEKNVTGADFRLELKYTPYGDIAPAPYGTHTTLCDTIIVTNSYAGFALISHDLPGYEGQEDRYPFRAVGYFPLYGTYPWLDLFGF